MLELAVGEGSGRLSPKGANEVNTMATTTKQAQTGTTEAPALTAESVQAMIAAAVAQALATANATPAGKAKPKAEPAVEYDNIVIVLKHGDKTVKQFTPTENGATEKYAKHTLGKFGQPFTGAIYVAPTLAKYVGK